MKHTLLHLALTCPILLAAPSNFVTGIDSNDASRKHKDISKIHSDSDEHGWEGAIDFGTSFTRGNSDTTYFNLALTLDKKRGRHDYYAKFSYAYGEDSGTTSSDELLATAAWRRISGRRFYTGLRTDFRRDDLADIDYRFGATLIEGYFLIQEDKRWLTPEIGLGFSSEKTGDDSKTHLNVYAGLHSEFKLSDTTRLYQTLSCFAPAEDFGDWRLWGELGVETKVTNSISLKIYLQEQYEAQPASGRDHNDLKIVTGLAYKF